MPLYPLKFHPDFTRELSTAIEYYDERSVGVGKKFRIATKKQLNTIKKTPFIYSTRYDDIRFARIDKFPYAIHYYIDTIDRTVLVQSLTSDHQNPNIHWRKKM